MTWQQSTIEEACLLITDGTHYTPPDVGEGVPFLTVKDFTHDGAIDLVGCSHITEAEFEKADRGNSAPKIGDVLFSKDGTVGKVYVVEHATRFAVLSSMAILRPDATQLEAGYFGWVLKTDSCLDQASRSKTGSAIRRIILKDLKRVKFPLPPLAEQKRIAIILGAADELRTKRRGAIELLDRLLQSTFLEMFGDPVTNPMGWKMGIIGDLLESATYGTSKKADITKGMYPILRMGNITFSGGWDYGSLKYIDLDEKDLGKHLVHRGQILFNRTNSKELVGKTAVYRENQPMAFAGYLVRGIVNEAADPEYIGAFMNTPQIKKYLQSKCKSIIGMANINAKEFQSIPIAAPPIDLQRRFASIVESVEQQKTYHHAHLDELDALFASLQSRAFLGEL